MVGGALGWKTKGSLDAKFEEIAFALEPSTTNSPKIGEAKTGFGYHIIMVRLHDGVNMFRADVLMFGCGRLRVVNNA